MEGLDISDIQNESMGRRLARLADDFASCQDVFVALGDKNRQGVFLELLHHYGGMRVGEIAEAVGLTRPAVSRHLKVLMDAGLVAMYSVGTKNFYHADGESPRWDEFSRVGSEARELIRVWGNARENGMERRLRSS